MIFKKRFPVLLLSYLFILDIILLSIWLQHRFIKQPVESPIQLKGADNFVNFGRNLNNLVNQKGISYTINLIKEGLQKGDITINQCHSLNHLLGHVAYAKFPDNFDILLKSAENNLLLCGGAYPHGIEAEIVDERDDPKATLNNFCEELLKKIPGFPCYHGAGHSFMQNSSDLNESLINCDRLQEGPTRDLSNCYRGVFSEYAFQVDGVDGDTGQPFPGGPKIKLPTPNPLDFCQTLEEKTYDACASQLGRLIFNVAKSDNIFEECVQSSYSSTIQIACVRIVSAVIAQRELTQTDTVNVPSYILTLSDGLRMAYIEGIAGEAQAFVNSGVTKNWQPICSSFSESQDIQRCTRLFGGS